MYEKDVQELKAKIVDLKKKNNDLEFQMQQMLINNKINE
jgi:ribosomal protein L29